MLEVKPMPGVDHVSRRQSCEMLCSAVSPAAGNAN